MSESVLSLDLSALSTGWAVFKDDVLVNYGLIKVKPKEGYGKRLSIFEEALEGVFDKYEVDKVVIEDIYRGPSIKTFKILSLFHGVAYKVCRQKALMEPELLKVTQIRKYLGLACGVKVKTKQQVFFIINNALKLGLEFSTGNDITDACALAFGYLQNAGYELSLEFDKEEYLKVGVDNGSIQGTGNIKKCKQNRSKKSISKARTKKSS